VYKSKGGETRQTTVDSARQNLASTFVNAFVNAGFGQDKLMTKDGSKWIFKNKDHGMMSAAASLGFILLWDVDTGINQIDKYMYANDENIQAGALLVSFFGLLLFVRIGLCFCLCFLVSLSLFNLFLSFFIFV
jgi:hypothetical protein